MAARRRRRRQHGTTGDVLDAGVHGAPAAGPPRGPDEGGPLCPARPAGAVGAAMAAPESVPNPAMAAVAVA